MGHRLTLISAPAGFGKTTLIATWLRSDAGWGEPDDLRAQRPSVAWLSLDKADNDPRRFLTYVVAALEQVRPERDLDVEAALQAYGQLPGLSPSETALVPLVNLLTHLETPLILVLDDYHTIERADIHEAIGFLINHLPPTVQVVIATRSDPPLSLANLRVRRQLTEIRADTLRFTLDEARAFFDQAIAPRLSSDDLARLERRTEGWIAGLQLAALSLQNRSPDQMTQFIAAFSGSNRHIIDYLIEEVLNQQSEEIRTFLLGTAILEHFTAPLCAAVTGREDARVILDTLDQSNLFLVPLDDHRTWYRYHRIFVEFLRYCLQAEPDRLHTLHARAAGWYQQEGMEAEAISHALAAGEMSQVVALIEQSANDMLMRSESVVVSQWLEALPAEIIHKRPMLSIIAATTFLIEGYPDETRTYLEAAESRIDTTQNDPDHPNLVGQIAALHAYLAIFSGSFQEGIVYLKQALADLPEENRLLRSAATWLGGLLHHLGAESPVTQDALDEALTLSMTSGNLLMLALSAFSLSITQIMQGHLSRGMEILQDGQRRMQELSPPWRESPTPGVALIEQGLATICLERYDLEATRRHIEASIELAERWGNAEVLTDSRLVLNRLCQIEGKMTEAARAIDAIYRMALAREDAISRLTIRQVDAYAARLYLAQGDRIKARRWVDQYLNDEKERETVDLPGVDVFIISIELSTLARIYIAEGEHRRALRRLTPMLQRLETAGWMGIVIELLILQAVAFRGVGDLPAAMTALDRALTLGQPEGYLCSFVNPGRPMVNLLLEARAEGRHVAYIDRLLEILERRLPGIDERRPDQEVVPLIEPLSDREREVLQLIADGLSNREIADRLYIAVSTVKSHINNLYSKLDVSNRAEAVARAGKLCLLS